MGRLLPYERRQRRPAATAGGSPEDARLVQRVSAGDERALMDIMDRYGAAILAFTQRIVGDRYLAEEITQDTMLKVWQQARTFRRDGHLRAWLFRVARNNAIDYMRRRRPPMEALGPTMPGPSIQPEEAVQRTWVTDKLEDSILELPSSYREVIALRYFHQMGYHEISHVLQIPVGTVKSRISYALNRLTKILHEKGVDASLVEDG